MVLHDSPWHAAQWSCQHKETHSLHNLHNIELFSRNPKYSLEAVSFFCFCQRQWLASNSSSVIWQLQSMRAIACLIQAAFCATYLEIFGIIWRFSMLDTPWAANASSACSRDRLRVQQWDGTSQSSIPCTQSI
jgi:hypothetical protein